MAAATDIAATKTSLKNLSNNGESNGTSHTGDSSNSSVDYWTNLLRRTLSTAQSIVASDSDSEDGGSLKFDEEVMNAPRRKTARDALAREVAARLYPAPPDSLAPIIKYEKDIVMLRSMVLDQRRTAIVKAAERNNRHNWIKRISKQGPWNENTDPLSLNGAPSLPMPVEQSDKESLAPFFAHLARGGTNVPGSVISTDGDAGQAGIEPYYNTELIEFEKGVLYADGRIDLCKMVAGPRNIGDLMDSLKPNTFSRHFLLGNNVIGPTGAKAIASFIDEFPDRMETWYLAGNCIDTASFSILVDSMVKSPAITNVWLKRNPLGSAAADDVFRLITQTPNLRTLDLDQTELGDAGVAKLFGLLKDHTPAQPLALRHIYMNAVGIGAKACFEIAQFLLDPYCTIESLFMSNNPVGDAVIVLAAGLEPNGMANRTLKRLTLQSCGLKDEGVIALAEAINKHTTLTALDIGQGYATEDLGMRYNWITDASAAALAKLVKAKRLQYLNISYTPTSQSALNTVLDAVTTSESLVWFHVKPLTTGAKDAVSVKAGQEYARLYKLARERLHQNVEAQYGVDYLHFENEHKRFLLSPKDVRFIDSVYRNRGAAAARRGLKKLEKSWDEDDETLQKVQDGTLG